MRTILLTLFTLVTFIAQSQAVDKQQLIDTATKGSGLFVNAKPLTLQLDKDRIFLYNEWLYDQQKIRLPDSVYVQFINNSKKQDTSHWTDQELSAFIVVKGKYASIDSNYITAKFATLDSITKQRFIWQVNTYNKTSPQDRRVFFYSRPVFDNTKTFALVQYDYGHSWLMGGGGIKLYQYEQGTWREKALLVRWSY